MDWVHPCCVMGSLCNYCHAMHICCSLCSWAPRQSCLPVSLGTESSWRFSLTSITVLPQTRTRHVVDAWHMHLHNLKAFNMPFSSTTYYLLKKPPCESCYIANTGQWCCVMNTSHTAVSLVLYAVEKAFMAETSCNHCYWFCYVSAHDQFSRYQQSSHEPLRHFVSLFTKLLRTIYVSHVALTQLPYIAL